MLKNFFLLLILTMVLACKHNNVNLQDNHKVVADTVNKNTVNPDLLIIPGKSIGNTHLNESLDAVLLKFGRADAGDAAMGASLNTWYAKHDTSGYQTDVYTHRNLGSKNEAISYVKLIRITSPAFKTAEYLNTGRALNDIAKHYRLSHIADYTAKTDTLKVYDDIAQGIAFEIRNNKCTGILIHAPNDSASSYISLHPNMLYNKVTK